MPLIEVFMNLRKLFVSMVACVCLFTPCIALASESVDAQVCFKQEYEVINARILGDDVNGEKGQTTKFAMDLARVYQMTGHYAEWFQPFKNVFEALVRVSKSYVTEYCVHGMLVKDNPHSENLREVIDEYRDYLDTIKKPVADEYNFIHSKMEAENLALEFEIPNYQSKLNSIVGTMKSLQEVQDYNLLKNAFIARNNALVIYIDTTYADHQMTEDQIAKAHAVFQNKHDEFVSLAKSLLQKYGS